MMEPNTIFTGDVLAGLKLIDDKTVNCVVTSPPYWNLRDYGMSGQLGLEKTPEEYVQKLVEIFREIKRTLRDDGTVWLNLGDSYAGYWGEKYGHKQFRKPAEELTLNDPSTVPNKASLNFAKHRPSDPITSTLQGSKTTQLNSLRNHENGTTPGIKPKDLIGIPWMVAFALRSDGWYLRSDIIWSKPNCMPESVTGRPTKSHEYIFLLSKSEKYYYDFEAIKTPAKESSVQRLSQDVLAQNGSARVPGKTNGNMKAVGEGQQNMDKAEQMARGANKRSVWTVLPAQFKEAHFATFPPELIVDCIKAGCPIDGIVLDPFMGAGTTAVVARKLNRNYIGIELNPKYVTIAQNRLYKELGMFL